MWTCSLKNLTSWLNSLNTEIHWNRHIWQRTFPFKALMAIFWELQPLWFPSLTKPDLLRFTRSSGYVFSKTKSVTPHFFTFLTSLTHPLSIVKFSEKNQCYKNFARTSLKVSSGSNWWQRYKKHLICKLIAYLFIIFYLLLCLLIKFICH